jgi:PAS domain S-box-containing protein
MHQDIKILIIGNNYDNKYVIKELLENITNIRYKLAYETSLDTTLKRLEKEKFDCIILDPNLSNNFGSNVVKNILDQNSEIPIVIFATIDDEDIATQFLHEGAQDYLIKDKINDETISRSILYAIERKKVENGLRDNERRYRNIVNTILEGLWITDKEGVTTYINKQLAKMLGYRKEDILNKPFFNFVDEPLRNNAKQFFERRKQGIKDRYDFRFVKKDGSILWVIVSASPIFDQKGRFAGTMGLLTDITDRKSIEQSLEKSLQEWNSTFDAISDIICIIDLDGKITHCNNAATRLFNKHKEEFIGQTCWNTLNCPSERFKNCPIINTQKTHKRESLTLQIGHKWFHSSVDPIVNKKNDVVGSVHVISDITKYKLAQDALKYKEELYRTITEYSNDMIWILDRDGELTFFNKRAEQISGYKLEELKGKNLGTLIIEKDLDKAIDIFHSTLKGNSQQYETIFKNKYNKQINLSINTTPIYSKGQIIGTLSSGRDITETVKYAKELKISNTKLEISNKELEDFAYTASHDLQEPVRSIANFAELLKVQCKDILDKDANEFIDYIVDGTRRMQQMIQDLLALSRVGTKGNEFVPVSVQHVLKDVQKNLHSMIERNNATITIENMPTINADPSQLTQLFQNLIHNAIKFRKKENPNIHISAKEIYIEYTGEQRDFEQINGWLFSVKDNGIGINQKDFDKLFKTFSRLHSRDKYPGTGIGLAMCKKIIEHHKGRIWLESKFGEGTTFYFTIPK